MKFWSALRWISVILFMVIVLLAKLNASPDGFGTPSGPAEPPPAPRIP